MARDREAAIQEARERLGRLRRKVNKAVPERTISGEVPTDLRPGEEVYLPKLNQRGYVLSPPGPGGEVQVQVGIMKISVPLKDLLRAEKTVQPGGQSQVGSVLMDKAREVSPELDLRGLYADEAMQQVEKYLDDACLAGLSKVYLIHGKGTGSLRAAIHRDLKGHHRVKSFRLGEQGEGGCGVTVVELA